ncbi:MAG: hypothetical protein K9M75_13390 [Phycisphaerae bacterium]|nr:hypothetical protein [Phycisphaerae bacterium]
MSNENLDKLIANFYDAEDASVIKEDIRIGDEIIASGDSLVPDAAVVSGIKREISQRLRSRQGRRMHMNPLRAAVAAMIVLVGFIGVRTMVHQVSPLPHNVSRGFFWGEDATASSIAYELDEIDNAIISISLGEDETESDNIIESLELEIMADSGSLWR